MPVGYPKSNAYFHTSKKVISESRVLLCRWRVGAEVRKVHFAEEWNEMHHLKIMESLGGDNQWIDR